MKTLWKGTAVGRIDFARFLFSPLDAEKKTANARRQPHKRLGNEMEKDEERVDISAGIIKMGACEPPEPAYEEIGVKPTLNAGSSRLQSRSSSLKK